MTNQESRTNGNISCKKTVKAINIKTVLALCILICSSVIIGTLLSNVILKTTIAVAFMGIGIFIVRHINQDIYKVEKINYYDTDLQKGLEGLLKSAEHVTKSGFGKKIKVTSDDEIGRLAETFNYLLDNVSNFIKELDQISEESSDSSRQLADITKRTSNVMQEVSATLQELT